MEAEYKGSEKNIVVRAIWEEKMTKFIEIADNPRRYVKEYLKRKKEEERNNKRWMHMHRKEFVKEKKDKKHNRIGKIKFKS